jgi:hypothetical protein
MSFRIRNQLLASREKLAQQERAAAAELRQVRAILDDMSFGISRSIRCERRD